jgi:hypothetical protein
MLKMFQVIVLTFIGAICSAQIAPPKQTSPWNILVAGGKGEYRGDPVCHSLSYFSGSPFRFDYDNDLFGMSAENVHFTTRSTLIGSVAGHKIFQVVQNINQGDIVMKRLLVHRQGDTFCSIYQQQYPAVLVSISPAKIETVSGEPVLITKDRNGERTLNQAYWTFDAGKPVLLDLAVIDRTLKQLLPSGDEVRNGFALDIHSLCYRSAVWKGDDCEACMSGGNVIMKLALRNHQLTVAGKWFDPDPNATSLPVNDVCAP